MTLCVDIICERRIGSSLEADVNIVVPGDAEPTQVTRLLESQEGTCHSVLPAGFNCSIDFLKTLFIVSDASIRDEGSLGTGSEEWVLTSTASLGGETLLPYQY
jgi:isoleucyl-tRNA synthetase